jgi:PAS domain S-box-containing protein
MLERRRAQGLALAANEQLERRVEQRTRALQAVNEELRKEMAQREHVEEDLRRQKELLQTIFDHVPVILTFSDKDGGGKMANREWERVLGRSKEELANPNLDILSESYPDPQERQRVRDVMANPTAQWADFKTTVAGGRVVDTSWAVVRLSDGATICIGQDISERKAAERELRKQKEILQTIFDHIPLMINFGDADFKVQLVNREWQRTIGWSVEEILNGNIDVLAENYPDPEYREQVRDFVHHSNGEWADFKTRVRDGRVIDTTWAMLYLPDGTSIGIGQDITRRKRAEEALRESEERFRQLTENIQDLFWIKTPDMKHVLYMSPIFQRLTGHAPEEIYGDYDYHQYLDEIAPEDREIMADIIRREVSEFDVEYRIKNAHGSLRWVRERGFPIRDQSGKIYRIAGITSDITEHKLAEDALRESEERFRQLTENIHEVFWLRSPDFQRLLYVSPLYEKVCGKTPEDIYTTGVDLSLIHPEDRALVSKTMQQSDGQGFEIEYRIFTKEGQYRWLRDRGFPIRNRDGKIYRIGGVAEDITERKQAEERLKASSRQLRALSANLQSAREAEAGRIARQIHDELGGFLTGLRWELEALDKMTREPANADHLKATQDKLASMLGLTDATITVVRRIASQLHPSILYDLGIVEAVEWQTQQFQARTGIECRCDCSLQSIPLSDQQSTAVFCIVQEALTNILRHAQATRVNVAMKEENGILRLKVSDNGRGITQAEMFNKKSFGLLGMQERAHLIEGHVEIVGEKGAGTTVHLRIPIQKSDPGEIH